LGFLRTCVAKARLFSPLRSGVQKEVNMAAENVVIDIEVKSDSVTVAQRAFNNLSDSVKGAAAQANKMDAEFGKTPAIISSITRSMQTIEDVRSKSTNPSQINAFTQSFGKLDAQIKAIQVQDLTAQMERLKKEMALGTSTQMVRKLADEYERLEKIVNDIKPPDLKPNAGLDGLGKMSGALTGIAGKIAGVFAVEKILEFSGEIFNITAEFQKYEAVLNNLFGKTPEGLAKTQAAMDLVKETAIVTPFEVKDVMDVFVQNANRGLILTKQQITSLGDLASSQGKGIKEFSEAFLDASSGEFERLKEFGIKGSTDLAKGKQAVAQLLEQATKKGDTGEIERLKALSNATELATFTFKGQKTVVENNEAAIQGAILAMGELAGVSGSMEAVSQTLGGKLSNLKDGMSALMLAAGKGGVGQAFGFLIDKAIEATNALNQFVAANVPTPIEQGEAAIKAQVAALEKLESVLTSTTATEAQKSASLEELNKILVEYNMKTLDATASTKEIHDATFAAAEATNNFIAANSGIAQVTKDTADLAAAKRDLLQVENELAARNDPNSSWLKRNGEDAIDVAATYLKFTGVLTPLGFYLDGLTDSSAELAEKQKDLQGGISASTKRIEDSKKAAQDAQVQFAKKIGFAVDAQNLQGVFKQIADLRTVAAADILLGKIKQGDAGSAEIFKQLTKQRAELQAQADKQSSSAAKSSGHDKSIEDEKKLQDQLRKLRETNLELETKDAIDGARRVEEQKAAFSKSEAELELSKSAGNANTKKLILFELERKFQDEMAEIKAKYRLKELEKDGADTKQALQTLHEQELLALKEQLSKGEIIQSDYETRVRELEVDGAQKRIETQRKYIQDLNQLTGTDKIPKVEAAQKELTAMLIAESNKRLDNDRKYYEIDQANLKKDLEFQVKYGDEYVRAQANIRLALIETANLKKDKQGNVNQAEATAISLKLLQTELDATKRLTEEKKKENTGKKTQAQADVKNFDFTAVSGAIEANKREKELRKESLDDELRAVEKRKEILLVGITDRETIDAIGAQAYKESEMLKTEYLREQEAERSAIRAQEIEKGKQLAQEALSFAFQLLDARDARDQKRLDNEKAASQAHIDANNKSLEKQIAADKTLTGRKRQEGLAREAFLQQQNEKELAMQKSIDLQKAKIEHDAAVRKKTIALIQAGINISTAVTEQLAGLPLTAPILALVIATGAIQVAAIAAQPLAKGSAGVTGGIEGRDSIHALLMPGEAVIPAPIARANQPLIRGLLGKTPDYAQFAGRYLQKEAQNIIFASGGKQDAGFDKVVDAIESNPAPRTAVHLDRDGVVSIVDAKHNKTKITNRRYTA
jgi:hypothetical protein